MNISYYEWIKMNNRNGFSVMKVLLTLFLAALVSLDMFAQTNTTSSISTRLQNNADGSISVSFQGQTGVNYQIYYSDTQAASPDKMEWKLASDNVAVESVGWTTWIDRGDGNRPGPSQVQQRFYRVIVTPAAGQLVELPQPVSSSSSTFQGLTKSLRLEKLQEVADAAVLLRALADGNGTVAVNILRRYGVSESTLTAMAPRLGNPAPPPRSWLEKPFLRAMVDLPISGGPEQAASGVKAAKVYGYERAYWVASSLGADWPRRYDQELMRCPVPPIGVLDVRLQELNTIEFFKWYDRYADRLHSVVLNWESLSNFNLKKRYDDANLVMNGLYKMIKARKPDAFVWARVVWQEDDSDVHWLQALTFKPDGLIIWNLHSFSSPFERARNKYIPLVGKDTPMMVADFFGYYPQAVLTKDPVGLGELMKPDLARMEERLQQIGYSGLGVEWEMINAIENGRND